MAPARRKKKVPPEADQQKAGPVPDDEESFIQRVIKSVRAALGSKKQKAECPTERAPFNIPPSQTDLRTFELKNPFVDVVTAPGNPLIDSVNKARIAREEPMEAAAIQRVMDHVFEPVTSSKLVARTGLGFRDIHISYVKSLLKMTLPAGQNKRLCVRSSRKQNVKHSTDSGQSGLYLAVELQGDPDPQDLQLRYEGGIEMDLSSKDRFGICVMVYDSRIKDDDNLVTVGYIECKKDDDALPEAIVQAACYAKQAVISNMERGRFSPVFLEGFSKTKWKFGMLIPFGLVTVKDGKVSYVESNFEDDTNEILSEKLEQSTRKLRRKYSEWECYPDGVYLSAVLYLEPDQEYFLPFINREQDDAFFYQTWLQIICGNDVRHISVEDVNRRLEQRGSHIQELHKTYRKRMAESRNFD